MKLSLRGDYALRALIVLARHYREPAPGGFAGFATGTSARFGVGQGLPQGPDAIVRIQTISEEQHIPKRFLEQILNDMKAGGFVESRRGIAGGYRLARPPGEIPLTVLIRWLEVGLLDGEGPHRAQHRGGVSGAGGRERDHYLGAQTNGAELAIQSVLQEVREAMLKALDGLTLADLLERATRLHPTVDADGMDFMI